MTTALALCLSVARANPGGASPARAAAALRAVLGGAGLAPAAFATPEDLARPPPPPPPAAPFRASRLFPLGGESAMPFTCVNVTRVH
jgi:hypothetical protein